MQITLEQVEIEAAVTAYVKSLGIGFAEDPKINFTAGRGTAGITAGIELTLADTVVPLGPSEVTSLAKKPKEDLEAFAPEPEEKPAPKKTKPAPAPKKAEEPPKEVATSKAVSGSESLFGATSDDDDELVEEEEDLVEEEDSPNTAVTADSLFAS